VNISIDLIAKAIKKIKITSKFFPSIAEIIVEARNQLPDFEPEKESVQCDFCNGNGYRHKEEVVKNSVFGDRREKVSYRCNCENGDKYPALPRWRGL